jgi:hypothetical protein
MLLLLLLPLPAALPGAFSASSLLTAAPEEPRSLSADRLLMPCALTATYVTAMIQP